MTRCIRCHRPLKNAARDGMGPTCYAKAGKPIPAHERDLFGFSPALAAEAATARLRAHVEACTVEALMAIRQGAAAARRRLGVWA